MQKTTQHSLQKKALVTAISIAALPIAVAQDNANTATLDTVVVESVYAVPAERDNTGSSVTVLTEKDFQQRNATYVIDALKTVPSIAVGSLGGHGTQTSVFMRGANSNHVLVVIDGVKMNPVSGSSFDFGTLPLSNVKRIEILRGEQSALWGSDAIGGVINITTKSGQSADKPFNATVNIGGGSNKTVDTDVSIHGRQGGLYYAINAAHNRSEGLSTFSKETFTYTAKDGTTVTTGGASEDDLFKQTDVALRLGYEFDRAGVEAFYQHSTNTVHYDSSLATENTSDPYTTSDTDAFKLSGYWGNHEDKLRHSAYFSLLRTESETESTSPTDNKGKRQSIGYQIDYNFDQEGVTTQGITGLLEYSKTSLNTNDFSEDKSIETQSAAVEYRLFNENDHALTVGLRYDDNSEFDNDITYRIAGGYRINDNLRMHSSIGSGIKNPSIYEYYGYYGTYTANPDLKPEKSRGGDIGLLIESNNGKHSLDITYFNRQITDLITSNSTYTQSINLNGKNKASGVEIGYNGQLTEQLSLYANYTYTKAEDSQGEQLARRPKHQANAGINYQINDAWSSNANIEYVGKRLNNYYNSATYQSTAVDMPSYAVVNIGTHYQINKNMALYLNVNNVFDKSYENVIGYSQPGRSFYLGFKGSW